MTQVSVGIFFNNGKVLLCQRKPTSHYPLKWEFPGGKAEADESPADCLRRELHEELGINAEVGKLFHRQHAAYPDNKNFDVSYFMISSYQGSIVNNVFESITWVTLAELVLYDILEGNRDVVQQLLKVYSNIESGAC